MEKISVLLEYIARFEESGLETVVKWKFSVTSSIGIIDTKLYVIGLLHFTAVFLGRMGITLPPLFSSLIKEVSPDIIWPLH